MITNNRRESTMKNTISIVTAAVLAAATATACGELPEAPAAAGGDGAAVSIDQGFGSKDASADVTLGAPVDDTADYGLGWRVPVNITNNSEKRSDYWITVAAQSGDGTMQVGTEFVIVNGLEPGQSTVQEATFLTCGGGCPGDGIEAGTVFVLQEVSRTAS